MGDQKRKIPEVTTDDLEKLGFRPMPIDPNPRRSPGVVMDKIMGWIFFVLVIGGSGYYLFHLASNYRHIHRDIRETAAAVVHPEVASDSVIEAGYVYDMRRETQIRDNRWALVWFIAVPNKNVKYSSQYEEGFQGFKVGDNVNDLHILDLEDLPN